MIKNILHISILFFLLFCSANSFAQNPTPDPKKIKFITTCKDDPTVFKLNGISGNVIRCIEKVVNDASDSIIVNYIEGFATVVFYCTMMAILFFSIRVMFGVASARNVTLGFAAKVMFVLAFTSSEMSDVLIGTRDTFLEAPKYFSVKILDAMDFSEIGVADEETVHKDIFDVFDSYILSIFGADKKDKQEEIFIGIAAVVGGLLFTGPVGATLTTIALGFVFTVVFAVAQAILFYATVTIAINFLLAISPIVAVALLFGEKSKRIALSWFVSFIGYAVQPIIFVAFMGIMLKTLDTVVVLFKAPYEKIQLKMENANGESNTQTTLFKCGTFKESATSRAAKQKSKNSITDNFIYGQLGMGFGMFQSGAGKYANSVDTGNDPSVASCRFNVPSIKIDSQNANHDPITKAVRLTMKDLQEFKALQFTVIVLLMLMMGFMKELPNLINKITSEAIVAPVSGSIDRGGSVVEAPIKAVQTLGTGATGIARTIAGSK